MSDLNVNLDTIVDSFPVADPGVYDLTIVQIDYAVETRDDPTSPRVTDKNGDEYLRATFEIVGGEFEGIKVFMGYINPKTSTFKDMCVAGGMMGGTVGSTEELVGMLLSGVTISQGTYKEKLQNSIETFR